MVNTMLEEKPIHKGAKLTPRQWQTLRFEREAGASFGSLAKKWGLSTGTIFTRSEREKWLDGKDAADTIRNKANEKANNIADKESIKKRIESIEIAADKTAEVINRHREETNAVRGILYNGLKIQKAAITKEDKQIAFEDLKAAKISSEVLLNIHKMERQAWGLDESKDEGKTIVIERSYGK